MRHTLRPPADVFGARQPQFHLDFRSFPCAEENNINAHRCTPFSGMSLRKLSLVKAMPVSRGNLFRGLKIGTLYIGLPFRCFARACPQESIRIVDRPAGVP